MPESEQNPQPNPASEPIVEQSPVAEAPIETPQPETPAEPVTEPVAEPVAETAAPIESTAPAEATPTEPEAAPVEQVAPAEPVAQEQPAAPATEEKKERSRGGRKRNNKLLFIIGGAILAIGAVIAAIFFINKAVNADVDLYAADAFFISTKSDGETKYALYKKDGEKITDFVYSQVGTFINHYAYVRNLDGKKGIIDDKGKMSVDFGEYEDITPRVGIYAASKDNKETLILGDGSEIASEYRSYDYSSSAPYVVVKYDNDQYELYNALGKKLADFTSSYAPDFTDAGYDTASALSYKGGLIILSNKNFKVLSNVETPVIYDIDDATEDGKTITFVERDKHYDDDGKRAIFKDKFVEFGSKCEDLDLHDSYTDKERVYVTCEVDGKDKLVRNGEVTDLTVTSYGDGYIVYDENHYAYYDSKDKKVDIYVNGEKKNTVSSDYRVVASTKGYVINNYKSSTVTLYDIDGNEAYKLSETSSSSELTGIDKNNNIVIRDGKQDSDKRYVVVNKDGKEISGRYSSIVAHGEYYSAYRRGDTETGELLDKDGKVIVSGEYNEFVYYDEDSLIFGKKGGYSDRSYDLINVKDKKVIANIKGIISYQKAGYIRATDGDKTSYYTRDGKLIYEYEDK